MRFTIGRKNFFVFFVKPFLGMWHYFAFNPPIPLWEHSAFDKANGFPLLFSFEVAPDGKPQCQQTEDCSPFGRLGNVD